MCKYINLLTRSHDYSRTFQGVVVIQLLSGAVTLLFFFLYGKTVVWITKVSNMVFFSSSDLMKIYSDNHAYDIL